VLRDQYVAAFNHGVRSGDWSPLLALVHDDATLEFVGIPVGPFAGRAAIRAAYEAQPPTDELILLDEDRYAWSREPQRPAGELHLVERDDKVAAIRVLYEQFS
jgi:SnoaL-like domain